MSNNKHQSDMDKTRDEINGFFDIFREIRATDVIPTKQLNEFTKNVYEIDPAYIKQEFITNQSPTGQKNKHQEKLEKIKDSSRKKWKFIVGRVSGIESFARELLEELSLNDEKLYDSIFKSAINSCNESLDENEVILFASKDRQYFHHVKIHPHILGINFSHKVYIIEDIHSPLFKFFYYISIILAAYKCKTNMLCYELHDAMYSITDLLEKALWIQIENDKRINKKPSTFTIGDFKQFGSLGGEKRKLKYFEAETKIRQISNAIWANDPSTPKDQIAQDIFIQIKNNPPIFGLDAPISLKKIKTAIGPSKRRAGRPSNK